MQDLNDLHYFVRVVDHGGFAAAARKTGIQKSRLSRRIQQLEARLGVRLLNRSSRRFSVTELGREYYERCVAVLVRAEAADQVIAQMQAEPRGIVRVSCQRPRAGMAHAVFPSRRGLLPSVRALLDFLAEECAEARKRAIV